MNKEDLERKTKLEEAVDSEIFSQQELDQESKAQTGALGSS